jgi:hypothetical protein
MKDLSLIENMNLNSADEQACRHGQAQVGQLWSSLRPAFNDARAVRPYVPYGLNDKKTLHPLSEDCLSRYSLNYKTFFVIQL